MTVQRVSTTRQQMGPCHAFVFPGMHVDHVVRLLHAVCALHAAAGGQAAGCAGCGAPRTLLPQAHVGTERDRAHSRALLPEQVRRLQLLHHVEIVSIALWNRKCQS